MDDKEELPEVVRATGDAQTFAAYRKLKGFADSLHFAAFVEMYEMKQRLPKSAFRYARVVRQ
jgi:hypothetical protein